VEQETVLSNAAREPTVSPTPFPGLALYELKVSINQPGDLQLEDSKEYNERY
jgi:hypothetical protein